jgi:hypothetical protein
MYAISFGLRLAAVDSETDPAARFFACDLSNSSPLFPIMMIELTGRCLRDEIVLSQAKVGKTTGIFFRCLCMQVVAVGGE